MVESASRRTSNSIRFTVASSSQDIMDAMTIRAIVYIEEQSVQSRLALDGNDFHATHLLIYDHDEPIGACRVRWFANFAKIERTAIRQKYRSPRLLKDFATFVFSHIAKKGYTQVITHAAPKYARLWKQLLHFEEVTDKTPAVFEGHDPYIELRRKLDPAPDPICENTETAVLFRVEGSWELKSDFEA